MAVPDPLALLAGITIPAAAATLLARPIARWAATRATAQPVDSHPDEELRVLAHLAHTPSDYPVVSPLAPEDFTTARYATMWAAIQQACAHIPLPEGDEPDLAQRLQHSGAQIPDLTEHLPGITPLDTPLTRTELEHAGQAILDASSDRTEYRTGLLPQQPGNDGEPPLVRRYREPSRRRVTATGALLGIGTAATMTLALTSYTSPAAILSAALAGVVVTIGTTTWSLIDLDTLYVDITTVIPITAVAWTGATLAAITGGDPARLLSGIAATAFVMTTLMLANGLYRLARGRNGLGAGDKYLAPATVGVPAAITGTWTLGYASLMAALLTATAAWLLLAAAARTGRNTPMAFAPYLATGWITATIAVTAATNL